MLPCLLKHSHTSMVWGQEISTKLFYGFLQLVHTHWSFIARAIIHWTLETPSCSMWIRGINPLVHHPSRSRWFRCIPAFLAPPVGTYKTDLYHLLGQAKPILGSWWDMFILDDLSKNRSLIWLGWHNQTRGLLVTPRNSLKLSVTPDIVSKLVTQILTPYCYKNIIHLPPCAIVWLLKIRPKTYPIPKAMLSMTYPKTHPITRSTRNNKEG
jgi:hypothetical protein